MYPGGGGDYSGSQGLGLLRLHSTFRHDLKIYASDEGRVSMTAAAFAKGLLALEGELTPILVQMVKSANTNGLLDNDCDAGKFQVWSLHALGNDSTPRVFEFLLGNASDLEPDCSSKRRMPEEFTQCFCFSRVVGFASLNLANAILLA